MPKITPVKSNKSKDPDKKDSIIHQGGTPVAPSTITPKTPERKVIIDEVKQI